MFQARTKIAASDGNQAARTIIQTKSQDQNELEITPEIFDAIEKLYQQPEVLATISRKSDYQLNDSAEYFFDQLPRLKADNYLRASAPTPSELWDWQGLLITQCCSI